MKARFYERHFRAQGAAPADLDGALERRVRLEGMLWGAEARFDGEVRFSEFYHARNRAEAMQKARAWAALVAGLERGRILVFAKRIDPTRPERRAR